MTIAKHYNLSGPTSPFSLQGPHQASSRTSIPDVNVLLTNAVRWPLIIWLGMFVMLPLWCGQTLCYISVKSITPPKINFFFDLTISNMGAFAILDLTDAHLSQIFRLRNPWWWIRISNIDKIWQCGAELLVLYHIFPVGFRRFVAGGSILNPH